MSGLCYQEVGRVIYISTLVLLYPRENQWYSNLKLYIQTLSGSGCIKQLASCLGTLRTKEKRSVHVNNVETVWKGKVTL